MDVLIRNVGCTIAGEKILRTLKAFSDLLTAISKASPGSAFSLIVAAENPCSFFWYRSRKSFFPVLDYWHLCSIDLSIDLALPL